MLFISYLISICWCTIFVGGRAQNEKSLAKTLQQHYTWNLNISGKLLHWFRNILGHIFGYCAFKRRRRQHHMQTVGFPCESAREEQPGYTAVLGPWGCVSSSRKGNYSLHQTTPPIKKCAAATQALHIQQDLTNDGRLVWHLQYIAKHC